MGAADDTEDADEARAAAGDGGAGAEAADEEPTSLGGGAWIYHWRDRPRPFVQAHTPAGHRLTVDAPGDHPWHHALWCTIKFVDGINFWEEYGDFGLLVQDQRPHLARLDGGAERATSTLRWVRPDGRVAVDEHLVITHHPIDEHTHALDWEVTLTPRSATSPHPVGDEDAAGHQGDGPGADGDRDVRSVDQTGPPHDRIGASTDASRPDASEAPPHRLGTSGTVFDRTPFTTWGGYGGLTVRGRPDWHDTTLRLPDGEDRERVLGEPAPWCALEGPLATEDADAAPDDPVVGVAVFDHPANPRFPTPWYASTRADTYGNEGWSNFCNAAFLWDEPLTVPPGGRLRLRHRVVTYDGRRDLDHLAAEWDRWVAATGGPAGSLR